MIATWVGQEVCEEEIPVYAFFFFSHKQIGIRTNTLK